MAEQKKINVCTGCGGELKLDVKYCPFCGVSQIKEQPIVAPIEVNVETERTNVVDDYQDKNETVPENNSALVSHITQKTNKELRGVIIMGGTLEQLKQYDRYAFKKQQGIFLRLKHLTLVPDHLLNADQLKLKYQHDITDINTDVEEVLEEQSPIIPVTQEAASIAQPRIEVTPFDTPQPKSSSFKYIAIAFIVILIVIFLVFSDKKEEVNIPADTGAEASNCEVANGEISSLLSEKMPVRALSIIKLYQDECKTNGKFVQLLVSAEAQATSAKEKIAIAKEYVQAGNLSLAHETVTAALDLDTEVTGGNELQQQIQLMIEQENNAQNEETIPTEEVEVPTVTEQPDSQQVDQAAYAVEQARRQAQAEHERQQAELLVRKQADRERQQAVELARKQEAEATRRQNEEKFDNQLSRAERALKSNNYGLARSLAREVLSSSSNNAQAKRILRQAEQGEAKAFDEMVIE
ncbi:MAG: hypothetical protein RR563_07215 [Acinetobacter sp.]